MRLELAPSGQTQHVSAADIVDYPSFHEKLRQKGAESELHFIQKFHAARWLFRRGFGEVLLDVSLVPHPTTSAPASSLLADACGVDRGQVMVVFCETKDPSEDLLRLLKTVSSAENAIAVLVTPPWIDISDINDRLGRALRARKLFVELAPSFSSGPGELFDEIADLMDLLANETRIRMLSPLLERPVRKREYRRLVNPKLLYENLEEFLRRGIVNEVQDDQYDLTELGRQILGEYFAFMEGMRRAVQRASNRIEKGGER